MTIITLDDLTSHLYGKLKADSDKLDQIRMMIKCKNIQINVFMDTWLEYNTLGMKVEADVIFIQKYNLEVEVDKLRNDEIEMLNKVKYHVNT